MAPKSKPSKKEAKSEAKPEAKMNKKAAPGKAAKGKAKEAEELQAAPVDQDELEEREEQAEAANHAAGGGNAAALAAANGTQESASFKNFRHHPDMENFYRFIYENDLRHEALAIIDTIMVDKQNRKQAAKGKHAH